MKKLFAVIILAATLLSLLSGCSERDSTRTRRDRSEREGTGADEKQLEPIEKAQAKAVEIGEQYLNFEITGDEAREMLNSIKVPETDGDGQIFLNADIGYLAFIIAKYDSTYEEIKEKVEWIASRDYTD